MHLFVLFLIMDTKTEYAYSILFKCGASLSFLKCPELGERYSPIWKIGKKFCISIFSPWNWSGEDDTGLAWKMNTESKRAKPFLTNKTPYNRILLTENFGQRGLEPPLSCVNRLTPYQLFGYCCCCYGYGERRAIDLVWCTQNQNNANVWRGDTALKYWKTVSYKVRKGM